jgi:putative transposase/transposase-like zinc-binding protein
MVRKTTMGALSSRGVELADIVRAHGDAYVESRGGRVSSSERRTLEAIASCRTAALGGHVEECDQCGHRVIAYNSCRNRHCPKCQAAGRAAWFRQRELELLPVEYFHVVFTIPQEIAAIALQNKKVVYDILFRAAADTLQTTARDPKHLGGEMGMLAVLHTWGQTLEHHPHVHCVVPGGGLAPDLSRWIACRQGFLFPVRVLGRLFRGKFLHRLQAEFDAGRLTFRSRLASLTERADFRRYLQPAFEKNWVVYAKPPFHGPEAVLKYLARYTHRVALANSRIVSVQGDRVSFTWKDYAHGGKHRVMTLAAVEFLRRFLLHVLPKGFPRIRYYGFLANRCRNDKLDLCRTLLDVLPDVDPRIDEPEGACATDAEGRRCPVCRKGTLLCVLTFTAGQLPDPAMAAEHPEGHDTS